MGNERFEIRLSGSGGQGIILAAMILAEAAGIHEGKEVCQTQSYGPEARGGASKAEVVISAEAIDYPQAIQPDLLLAMNQTACDTYFPDLKADGLLVVDATLVKQIPTARVVAIPFTQISQEITGKKLAANVVALGAICAMTDLITPKSLEAALLARAPEGTQKPNLEAMRAGLRAARAIDLSALPRSITPPQDEEV